MMLISKNNLRAFITVGDLVAVAAAVRLPFSNTGIGAVPGALVVVKIEVNGHALRVIVYTLLDALRLRVSLETSCRRRRSWHPLFSAPCSLIAQTIVLIVIITIIIIIYHHTLRQ